MKQDAILNHKSKPVKPASIRDSKIVNKNALVQSLRFSQVKSPEREINLEQQFFSVNNTTRVGLTNSNNIEKAPNTNFQGNSGANISNNIINSGESKIVKMNSEDYFSIKSFTNINNNLSPSATNNGIKNLKSFDSKETLAENKRYGNSIGLAGNSKVTNPFSPVNNNLNSKNENTFKFNNSIVPSTKYLKTSSSLKDSKTISNKSNKLNGNNQLSFAQAFKSKILSKNINNISKIISYPSSSLKNKIDNIGIYENAVLRIQTAIRGYLSKSKTKASLKLLRFLKDQFDSLDKLIINYYYSKFFDNLKDKFYKLKSKVLIKKLALNMINKKANEPLINGCLETKEQFNKDKNFDLKYFSTDNISHGVDLLESKFISTSTNASQIDLKNGLNYNYFSTQSDRFINYEITKYNFSVNETKIKTSTLSIEKMKHAEININSKNEKPQILKIKEIENYSIIGRSKEIKLDIIQLDSFILGRIESDLDNNKKKKIVKTIKLVKKKTNVELNLELEPSEKSVTLKKPTFENSAFYSKEIKIRTFPAYKQKIYFKSYSVTKDLFTIETMFRILFIQRYYRDYIYRKQFNNEVYNEENIIEDDNLQAECITKDNNETNKIKADNIRFREPILIKKTIVRGDFFLLKRIIRIQRFVRKFLLKVLTDYIK